jgi:hypothetical protein
MGRVVRYYPVTVTVAVLGWSLTNLIIKIILKRRTQVTAMHVFTVGAVRIQFLTITGGGAGGQ